MTNRYFLFRSDDWIEVTKEEYVRVERQAGFRNTMGQPDEPATAAFGSGALRGRIQYGFEPDDHDN